MYLFIFIVVQVQLSPSPPPHTHRSSMPSGFRKFPVHNVQELEVLLVCSESHWAEIAHSVSSENRRAPVDRAAPPAITGTNPDARLRSEENEYTDCVHIVFNKNIKFCKKKN